MSLLPMLEENFFGMKIPDGILHDEEFQRNLKQYSSAMNGTKEGCGDEDQGQYAPAFLRYLTGRFIYLVLNREFQVKLKYPQSVDTSDSTDEFVELATKGYFYKNSAIGWIRTKYLEWCKNGSSCNEFGFPKSMIC